MKKLIVLLVFLYFGPRLQAQYVYTITADSVKLSGTYAVSSRNIFEVKGNGYIGVATDTPTSKLDITGQNGFNQLRLRTSYTPTSSSDTNGNVGDFSWDNNYLYIKTSSGWVRSALTTF
jgi:hypothetical protein